MHALDSFPMWDSWRNLTRIAAFLERRRKPGEISRMSHLCNATIGHGAACLPPHFLNPYAILLGFYPSHQPPTFVVSGARFGTTD
jgi:hypothetical protein